MMIRTSLFLVGVTSVIAVSLLLSSSLPYATVMIARAPPPPPSTVRLGREDGRTLVVMVHAPKDETYHNNLVYFLRKAVRCWQDADYRIILQGGGDPTRPLPPLPANAKYVTSHENKCLDWGTMGWLMGLPQDHPDSVDTSLYKFFILMNSSARGPFFPTYIAEQMDPHNSSACTPSPSLFSWFDVFLHRINSVTKYVGCTISCMFHAHVQSYVVAMDFIALQVLWYGSVRHYTYGAWAGLSALPLSGNSSLRCPENWEEAVFQGEIGASRTIIDAGYNFASLMHVYGDSDFRLKPDVCASSWTGNPSAFGSPKKRGVPEQDTVALNPLEVVFMKDKEGQRWSGWDLRDAIIGWEQDI